MKVQPYAQSTSHLLLTIHNLRCPIIIERIANESNNNIFLID